MSTFTSLYRRGTESTHVFVIVSFEIFQKIPFAFNHTLVNVGIAISLFHGFKCDILSSKEPHVSLRLVIPNLQVQEQEEVRTKERETKTEEAVCVVQSNPAVCIV